MIYLDQGYRVFGESGKRMILAKTKPILTMKKVLLTVFAACLVFAASAQISKGTILVGGSSNLNFISNNEDAGDDSNFTLDLKGGYFFMDNLTAGLNLYYDKYSEADDATVGIGPFVRYYVNGKIILGLGFNSISQGDVSGSAIPLEVGYAWFLGDAVAVEPTLNYTSYGGDFDGASFGLKVGISVYLGKQ